MAPLLRDNALMIAAAAIGIAVSALWPHREPARCPQPSGASVEALFAPCLVAAESAKEPAGPASGPFDVVPPPVDQGPAVARGPQPREIEATGSVPVR